MSILTLVTSSKEIDLVVPWAARFAAVRDDSLTILCWNSSTTPQEPQTMGIEESADADSLVMAVRDYISGYEDEIGAKSPDQPGDAVSAAQDAIIQRLSHPDATMAMLERIEQEEPILAIAAAKDQTGQSDGNDILLTKSPCNTIVLYGNGDPCTTRGRVFVGTADCANDGFAVFLATTITKRSKSRVNIARLEDESGEENIEVGRREISQLMRDMGVKPSERIRRRVFLAGDSASLTAAAGRHDLALIGMHSRISLREMLEKAPGTTIAVVKRAPPLRIWDQGKLRTDWLPHISPADHADLIQTLRHGSILSRDFLMMLGLAASIASLGLLQDSPAIVIGSMLLAPLMTPMIGNGLALAQANPKLGRRALLSVFVGFLLTLIVSSVVAFVTPGEETTSQVMLRGNPNILDLLVAFFSGAAAAYAMARPSLTGSVAGVAIATALVPPLCCCGISLVYRQFDVAGGAALLFVTNVVAIVLGAALTFRWMGVSADRANVWQRLWVFRTVGIFGIVLIVLAFPLQRALQRNIDTGKTQPNSFPLTMAVLESLVEYIEKTPDLELIASGRPSSIHDEADVVLVLASPSPLSESYADELIRIVRREMDDESLLVKVHCLREAWQRK